MSYTVARVMAELSAFALVIFVVAWFAVLPSLGVFYLLGYLN
jgi:hypothetical protein